MRRIRYILPALFAASGLFSGTHSYAQSPDTERAPVTGDAPVIMSHLSGTAFVTRDLDASIYFYTEYLNYSVRRRTKIDEPASLAVFGMAEGAIDYAALVPHSFSSETPYPGLNFAEVAVLDDGADSSNLKRRLYAGEPLFAFSVQGISLIEEKMRNDNVLFIVPLAVSATGRSMTLTVLDPNGMRVQMYEMLE
ncbi:VOC family protein [Algimonas porphyrae]|uniref:VOC domain-containing protein n=1 Tax=Algimonas porphyrae TaxID=1128113 RepID=A0ABQ5V538_9PROT|nr:VOC family protein [Algimonas porphyrae]GLQ22097.1 hypothetical protein GCM10007854_30520 [Algimonas porphyrae]